MQIIFVKFMKRVLFTWVFEVEELNKIESVSTPIVIANHVSWMDVVYLVTRLYPVSIVAKDEISNALLVGSIAKYLQCLFISRESKDARKELLEQIKERVLQYQPSVNVNPLLIFPEGTTSNGRSILRFKLGAFAEKPKITIFGLIYDC